MNEIEIYKARKIKDYNENDRSYSEGFLIKNDSEYYYITSLKDKPDQLTYWSGEASFIDSILKTLEKIYPLPEHEKQEPRTLKDIIGGTKIKIEVEWYEWR